MPQPALILHDSVRLVHVHYFIECDDRCYRVLNGDNTPLQHAMRNEWATDKYEKIEVDAEGVLWACYYPYRLPHMLDISVHHYMERQRIEQRDLP